jgi:hypothetical protein
LDGLDALVLHLGAQDWMRFQYGAFRVSTGAKRSLVLSAEQAIELGLLLETLRECKGFAEWTLGFNNPTQFQDTWFEGKMAAWCLRRPCVRELQFEPKYSIRGSGKRPDFELRTSLGRVVCECKRLHMENDHALKRLQKVAGAFRAAAEALGAGDRYRLDVNAVRRVTGNVPAIAVTACHAATAAVGQWIDEGPFRVRLVPSGSPIDKNEHRVLNFVQNIGAVATQLDETRASVTIASDALQRAMGRAAGALMTDAMRQLPRQRASAIFVDCPMQQGLDAARVRIGIPAYAHCITIAVFRGGELKFAYVPSDLPVISWLFTATRKRPIAAR